MEYFLDAEVADLTGAALAEFVGECLAFRSNFRVRRNKVDQISLGISTGGSGDKLGDSATGVSGATSYLVRYSRSLRGRAHPVNRGLGP